MSIGMAPCTSLYGYEALAFASLTPHESLVSSAQDFIQQRSDILKTLKENLLQAHNQQKICADVMSLVPLV